MGSDIVGRDSYRWMIEAAPTAMIITGESGEVRYANAETERMFGYGREELVGRPVEILVPARLRRRHAIIRRQFMTCPGRRMMGVGRDLRARRRDGSEFPIEIGLAPVATPSGVFVTATVIDLTERRETEEALAQSVRELERCNERLVQFAYVAALDLQEPLLEIATQSERLEKAFAAVDRDGIAAASSAMRRCALGARKLVEDLLIYARTIYGEQRLEMLELREEVQFSLAQLSQLITRTNAQVSADLPAATFIADRAQFALLLQNIVANAIKYRKPGVSPKVDISGRLEDEQLLHLSIADNGIGFDEEFAQRIFEPFSRPSANREYAGTGMELAICKSIADRHGWSISIRSHPGEGATFAFSIPILFAIPTLRG